MVDVQNDFCPGGALPVPHGDDVVPVLNGWIAAFRGAGRPVVYTQDWHPPRHVSFRERGGPWPVHCVQGTHGAEFHPGLKVLGPAFRKGFELDRDAYSGLQGRLSSPGGPSGADLETWLRERGVRRVYIGGLAEDYCVKSTALDALKGGFETVVIREATRPVEVNPGDGELALKEVEAAGGSMA